MHIERGITATLARARGLRISELRYALRFELLPETSSAMQGEVAITFLLAGVDGPLVLDFAPNAAGRLISCEVNGARADVKAVDGHLTLPASMLQSGENTVRIAFVAGDASLERRADHLYTRFGPLRAHQAFPCFDQPNLKARWALTLSLPPEWTAVANCEVGGRRTLVSETSSAQQRTVIEFTTSAPMAPSQIAFVAGRLHEHGAARDGRKVRVFHCGADPELLNRNVDTIANEHVDALRWLEAYTDMQHPFGKLDVVLLPSLDEAGVSQPGLIVYDEMTLLLHANTGRMQGIARAELIANQAAQQWFGGYASPSWLNDFWLPEAIGRVLASKIVHPRFADVDHELRFMQSSYPPAYDADRTAGAHAVREAMESTEGACILGDAISTFKASIVIRQIAWMVGDLELRDALREWLDRYGFGNAAWPDVLEMLALRSAVDLFEWSRTWIDRPGRPQVRVSLDPGLGLARLELHTSDVPAPPTLGGRLSSAPGKWPQRLEVALGYPSSIEHVWMRLDGRADVTTIVGYPPPEWVLPNGHGLGYGEFKLDQRSIASLMTHLTEVTDPLTRGCAWLTLWDAMLAGEVDAEDLLGLAIRAVPLESNEANLQRVLGDIERIYWVFLSREQRSLCAKRLAAILRAAAGSAASTSAKTAVFACLRAVATTDATIEWMRGLWGGQSRGDGPLLTESDQIALVKELAVRVSDGDAIVQQQIDRTIRRDWRNGLSFIAPALSSNPSARDQFFRTISDPINRRREGWVVEGLRWLNHPLRADWSKFLEPSLELLDEVRKSGSPTLPKRWLDAVLGRHGSPEAAQIVERFLATRGAAMPPVLRQMVLTSADYLFRGALARRVLGGV
jgi:aminopeptidase N